MIKVENVYRYYGDACAIKDLSFSVGPGKIHGLLGPNGAGKTTMMKMLGGILPMHAGKIIVNDLDVAKRSLEVRKNIGILLEVPPLFHEMQVDKYLEFAARLHLVRKKKARSLVDEALEKLNLTAVRSRIIGNLSKGFKQKVGVAQAIVHRPQLVILDEPTSGLDPKAVIEMRELILDLKKDHTVIFSSHLLSEAQLLCEEVTIISQGSLLVSSSIEEIGKHLSQKEVIKLEVKRISENGVNSLKDVEGVELVEIEEKAEKFHITLMTDPLRDQREAISKIIVKEEMGLLHLSREGHDLEKIFLKVTEEEKK